MSKREAVRHEDVRLKEVRLESLTYRRPLKCLVITLSDRAAAGQYDDRSGPRVRELVEAFFAGRPERPAIANCLLPDYPEQLRQEIVRAKESGVDVLITTGGTGVGPRDVTPETVAPLCDKLIPGIMEHIRMTCGQKNPRARLGRSIAGVSGTMQIYTLPGSVRAVEEYMPTILETVEHLFDLLHARDDHG
jgi:molybdenum cofactor synthesis domain-containing protein